MGKIKFQLMLLLAMCMASSSAFAAVKVTAVPADSSVVKSLYGITLTFTDYSVADWDYTQPTLGTITNDATGDYSLVYHISSGEALNQLILEFKEITAEGNYTVSIPGGVLVLNNIVCYDPVVLHYTVGKTTGIEDINVEGSLKGIRVNLNGQRVGNDYQGVVIENGVKKIMK